MRDRCLVLLLSLMVMTPLVANVPAAQIKTLLHKPHTVATIKTSPVIKDLQSNYFFVVFFRSTCPHCHRFIPVLQDFAHFYGVKITAYSVDGPDLDTLHSRKMQAAEYKDYFLQGGFKAVVPALFLQNKHTQQVYPVLFGEATSYQLATRMNDLLKHIQESEHV